jgi:hypothetical protein
MAIIRDERHERLRFGVGEFTDMNGSQRESGVAIFDRIPVGSLVTASLDVPTELTTNLVATGAILASLPAQAYIFERAANPVQYQAGGVSVRGRQRVLVQSGNGVMTPVQAEPDWAAFAPSHAGAIVQKGKKYHSIQMPGGTPGGGGDFNLKDADRNLLRLRWTATARVAQALAAATGAKQTYSAIQLLTVAALPATNIAPGSLVINFTKPGPAAAKLRDNGRGRIVGIGGVDGNGNALGGDGFIDYLTGIFTFTFQAGAAAVAAVTADFEHSCAYQPIDALLEWDAQMAQ